MIMVPSRGRPRGTHTAASDRVNRADREWVSVRKLVYYIATTLDGFIAGPDGADPSGPGGFWPIPDDYIQHIAAEYPETLPAPARAALSVTAEGTHFDTAVEGRRTYEIGLKAGIANAYPHLRHLVFPAPWPKARTPPSTLSPRTRWRRCGS